MGACVRRTSADLAMLRTLSGLTFSRTVDFLYSSTQLSKHWPSRLQSPPRSPRMSCRNHAATLFLSPSSPRDLLLLRMQHRARADAFVAMESTSRGDLCWFFLAVFHLVHVVRVCEREWSPLIGNLVVLRDEHVPRRRREIEYRSTYRTARASAMIDSSFLLRLRISSRTA
jgi:hypothetical protein